jgi:hypothetical protein
LVESNHCTSQEFIVVEMTPSLSTRLDTLQKEHEELKGLYVSLCAEVRVFRGAVSKITEQHPAMAAAVHEIKKILSQRDEEHITMVEGLIREEVGHEARRASEVVENVVKQMEKLLLGVEPRLTSSERIEEDITRIQHKLDNSMEEAAMKRAECERRLQGLDALVLAVTAQVEEMKTTGIPPPVPEKHAEVKSEVLHATSEWGGKRKHYIILHNQEEKEARDPDLQILQLIAKVARIETTAFMGFERLGVLDKSAVKCRPVKVEVPSFIIKLRLLRAAYTLRRDCKIHISECLTPKERANRQLKSHMFQQYQQQGYRVQFRKDQLWIEVVGGCNEGKYWMWVG